MAKWALGAFVAAGLTALFTGIAVFLLWKTLGHTRDAATHTKSAAEATWKAVDEGKKTTEAANEATRIAADTARRELRAYLSVVPAGINQLIGRGGEGMGHVTVRNVGKLPERNVSVVVYMNMFQQRETDFLVPNDFEKVQRVIQPGTEMPQGSREKIPVSDITRIGNYIFVWGVVYYDDGYENRRFTRFCHRYATASYNRDTDWNSKAKVTRSIIDTDKARYHTKGNEAD